MRVLKRVSVYIVMYKTMSLRIQKFRICDTANVDGVLLCSEYYPIFPRYFSCRRG